MKPYQHFLIMLPTILIALFIVTAIVVAMIPAPLWVQIGCGLNIVIVLGNLVRVWREY